MWSYRLFPLYRILVYIQYLQLKFVLLSVVLHKQSLARKIHLDYPNPIHQGWEQKRNINFIEEGMVFFDLTTRTKCISVWEDAV